MPWPQMHVCVDTRAHTHTRVHAAGSQSRDLSLCLLGVWSHPVGSPSVPLGIVSSLCDPRITLERVTLCVRVSRAVAWPRFPVTICGASSLLALVIGRSVGWLC